MWLRGVSLLLQGPIYETILCRCPCLDTHQPPTHLHTHHYPPTHTQTHHFTIPVRCQAQCEGRKKPWKSNFLVCLPPISPRTKQTSTRHLSFQHSVDSSTLTSHSSAWALSEYSHSHLSPLASTCFEFDTCLPTPTRRQRKSQQVTPTVCRPAALNTTKTLTNT